MNEVAAPRPPAFKDARDYARAREVLLDRLYTEPGIAGLIGPRDVSGPNNRDYPVLMRLTRGGGPLATLLRLLHLGVPVTEEAARAAVAPMSLESWLEAGLVSRDGEEVNGAVRLVPFEGLWLASDPPRAGVSGLPVDFTVGVGDATKALAGITIDRPVKTGLDLGTGCGVLALKVADHADRVVAVDRNPRALAYARFNADLNEKRNIEFREGDLFEPVEGERFDLVISNPPFVISPRARYTFRDSGLAGDGFVQRIVREVPAFLEEGGYCQIMCQWAHLTGQDWKDRLGAWFTDAGCDVWVMRSATQEPFSYAMSWISTTELATPAELHQRFDEWMDSYQEQRIEAFSDGFINLRKRSGGTNWLRFDTVPRNLPEPIGEDIALSFELRDFLEAHPADEDLLGRRLRLAPMVRLEQSCRQGEHGWRSETIEICRDQGLAVRGTINPTLAQLLVRCDGTRPVGDLIQELARELDEDPAAVVPETLRVLRTFIQSALLLPEGIGAPERSSNHDRR